MTTTTPSHSTTTTKNNQNTIIQKLLLETNRLKREGNVQFTSANYSGAEVTYTQASKVVGSLWDYWVDHPTTNSNCNSNTSSDVWVMAGREINTLRAALIANRAFVLIRLGRCLEAEQLCSVALSTTTTDTDADTTTDTTSISNGTNDKQLVNVNVSVNMDDVDRSMRSHNKLWYRRAQAREALGDWDGAEKDLQFCLTLLTSQSSGTSSSNNNSSKSSTKDTEAMLERIRGNIRNTGEEGEGEKEEVEEQVRGKDDDVLHQLSKDEDGARPTTTSSIQTQTKTNTTKQPASPPPHQPTTATTKPSQPNDNNTSNINKIQQRPSPKQQMKDILQLLSQSTHTTTTTTTTGGAVGGEAFFLLNVQWWTMWCRHVNFFLDWEYYQLQEDIENYKEEDNEDGGGGGDSGSIEMRTRMAMVMRTLEKQREQRVTSLPRGGSIPEQPLCINNNNNTKKKKRKKERSRNADATITATTAELEENSSSELSSSSSEEEEEEDMEELINTLDYYGPPPGSIDNSVLILPPWGAMESLPPTNGKNTNNDNNITTVTTNAAATITTPIGHANDRYTREWRHHGIRPHTGGGGSTKWNQTLPTTNQLNNNNNNNNNEEDDNGTIQLRTHLIRGHHYEVLPREVYAALRCWYGECTRSIYRRSSEVVMMQNDGSSAISSLHIYLYPDIQLNTYGGENFAPIVAFGDGTTTVVHFCGACKSIRAHSRCTRCMSVYYCGRGCQASHWPYHKVCCKLLARKYEQKQQQPPNTATTNTNNNKININTSPLRSSPNWGLSGLHNLGNTCFLNAALQCLSHSTPLTRHFLTNRFKDDLTISNPLGARGELALAYAILQKELWMGGDERGHRSAVSPIGLKRAIARFAPRFGGNAQHDAQEFLAFLLDGLHEDLNTTYIGGKKSLPYVEDKDVGEDESLTIAGAEAWDGYCRRNRSLVMDTFYGQFKSEIVCPGCGGVSVSYDVFSQVSLEIPRMTSSDGVGGGKRVVPVVLFRAVMVDENGDENGTFTPLPPLPMRYGVAVPRNGTILDVKHALSQLSNLPPSRLITCDVYEHSIYEFLPDDRPITEIGANDVIVVFEADPYTSSTMHAIAVNVDLSNRNGDSTEDVNDGGKRDLFGYPLLTSFGTGLTCGEIWKHLWKQVSHLVREEDNAVDGDDDDDGASGMMSFMQIRIVDSHSQPRPIFQPGLGLGLGLGSTEEEEDAYSILPKSDEKLASILGPDCAESFLFLKIEWRAADDPHQNQHQITNHHPNRSSSSTPIIFVQPSNHSSYTEILPPNQHNNNTRRCQTLHACFENFIRPEHLDDDNRWYCSNCKEHVRATKTMALWRLPNILIVHLKRFELRQPQQYVIGMRRGNDDKLDTYVECPLEGLDMGRYCASSSAYRRGEKEGTGACGDIGSGNGQKQQHGPHFDITDIPAVYDLFAVTNHYGRMGFGHYTAVARRWNEHEMEEDWTHFDDTGVSRTTGGGDAVSSAAYILFYRRRVFS